MDDYANYAAGQLAAAQADKLIAAEIERQDKMWGVANERAAVADGQLFHAGLAQLDALLARTAGDGWPSDPPVIYPRDWSGFRDYGSDVANLVVAVAFLRQEIKRLIEKGESTTRAPRNYATQPYGGAQPAVQT